MFSSSMRGISTPRTARHRRRRGHGQARGSSRSEYYVGGEEENRIYDPQRLLMKVNRVSQDRLKLT